jgi:hypothetical protein
MRWSMKGVIASAGFASGDRVVIGHWQDTPLGSFNDLRWTRPDGSRLLVVPDAPVGDLLSAIDEVDGVDVAPVLVTGGEGFVEVVAGSVEVQLRAGVGYRVPFPRPPWVTRWIEAPIARAAFGVDAYSVTPSGVRTWRSTDEHRPVSAGWATVDGRDLGALVPRSSIAKARLLLEDPSGGLDQVVRAAARQRVGVTSG